MTKYGMSPVPQIEPIVKPLAQAMAETIGQMAVYSCAVEPWTLQVEWWRDRRLYESLAMRFLWDEQKRCDTCGGKPAPRIGNHRYCEGCATWLPDDHPDVALAFDRGIAELRSKGVDIG